MIKLEQKLTQIIHMIEEKQKEANNVVCNDCKHNLEYWFGRISVCDELIRAIKTTKENCK